MDRSYLHRIGLRIRREIVALNQSCKKPFAAEHLGGGCAVGAWVSCRVFDLLSIENTFVLGFFGQEYDGDHCWTDVIEDSDCEVFDVTATQFGIRPQVIHTPYHSPLGKRYYVMHRGEQAMREVAKKSWQEQSPMRYQKQLETIAQRIAENAHR